VQIGDNLKLSECGLSVGEIAPLRNQGLHRPTRDQPGRYRDFKVADNKGGPSFEPQARQNKKRWKGSHPLRQPGWSCPHNRKKQVRKEQGELSILQLAHAESAREVMMHIIMDFNIFA
jgi:hypothetical protein